MRRAGRDGEEEDEKWEVLPPPESAAAQGWSTGVSLEEACPALINPNYFAVPGDPPESADVSEREGSPGWVEPAPVNDSQMNVMESASPPRLSFDESSSRDETDAGREEEATSPPDSSGEGSRCSGTCWWNIPAELWKGKALWSFAVAAALTGFVLLGRRWYRLRSQNKKLSLRVSAHDKKIARLMFQVIGLNETFAAVRRVPVVTSPITFAGCQRAL